MLPFLIDLSYLDHSEINSTETFVVVVVWLIFLFFLYEQTA